VDGGSASTVNPVKPRSGPYVGAALPASPVLLEARVMDHGPVTSEYLRLGLHAPAIADLAQPGQFVMLTVARDADTAPVLPRPMAIFRWERRTGRIEIVYRVVGEGTHRLSQWSVGQVIVTVGPLGRGFVIPSGTRRIVLLGRGIGTCSLTALAAVAAAQGVDVRALLSARHADALVGGDACRASGAREVREVVDNDGSSDIGLVGAWLKERRALGVDQIYVCGSGRLLDLATATGVSVQVSLEAHMACGIGYCHGCASGHPGLGEESPLVCRDGPVFQLPAV